MTLYGGPAAGTRTSVAAHNRPASGPVSKAAVSRIGPAGAGSGTRTEAGQNVPQAKPDRAVLTDRPPASSANSA